MRKEYGEDSVGLFMEDPDFYEKTIIPTGSLGLNRALGRDGGIAGGRFVLVIGQPGSGKTTFIKHQVASCQRQGGVVAYADLEFSFDPVYAEALGINCDEILFLRGETAEDVLNQSLAAVKSGLIDLLVVDSLAALQPKAEMEEYSGKKVGDVIISPNAKLINQFCRQLPTPAFKNDVQVICVNQYREKAGVMMGDPRTLPGGKAPLFIAHYTLEMKRIEKITKAGETLGWEHACTIKKHKRLGETNKTVFFQILRGVGIDQTEEIPRIAVEEGIVQKRGGWFQYEDIKEQGYVKFMVALRENDKLEEISKKVIEGAEESMTDEEAASILEDDDDGSGET